MNEINDLISNISDNDKDIFYYLFCNDNGSNNNSNVGDILSKYALKACDNIIKNIKSPNVLSMLSMLCNEQNIIGKSDQTKKIIIIVASIYELEFRESLIQGDNQFNIKALRLIRNNMDDGDDEGREEEYFDPIELFFSTLQSQYDNYIKWIIDEETFLDNIKAAYILLKFGDSISYDDIKSITPEYDINTQNQSTIESPFNIKQRTFNLDDDGDDNYDSDEDNLIYSKQNTTVISSSTDTSSISSNKIVNKNVSPPKEIKKGKRGRPRKNNVDNDVNEKKKQSKRKYCNIEIQPIYVDTMNIQMVQ